MLFTSNRESIYFNHRFMTTQSLVTHYLLLINRLLPTALRNHSFIATQCPLTFDDIRESWQGRVLLGGTRQGKVAFFSYQSVHPQLINLLSQ